MSLEDIESKVRVLVSRPVTLEFVYDLLLAYGLPKATVSRLKKGTSNLSKEPNEVLEKKRVHFRFETEADLHGSIG